MQPSLKPKSKKDDSPKTPGGISKALLTPIRRLGLSRNFRKNGPSPFRSPLSGTVVANASSPSPKPVRTRTETAQEPCDQEVNSVSQSEELVSENDLTPNKNTESIVATPTRSVSQPRKKKSKSERPLLSVPDCDNTDQLKLEISLSTDKVTAVNGDESTDTIQEYVEVSTPVKSKSRLSRSKRSFKKIETTASPVKKVQKVDVQIHNEVTDISKENVNISNVAEANDTKVTPKTVKERTPNDLTRECVVAIQKKIFKHELKKIENDKNTQVLFESDSDEPLSNFNKDKSSHGTAANSDNDDDFEEPKIKVKILEDKNTSTSGLKPTTKIKKKPKTQPKQKLQKTDTNIQTSQGSLSFDDDDFDFDNRKTILVHRSYTKPHKAKSTGSITQKDIDDLSARIEMKKKLLMAKAINKDTEELRDLTKKWQKGCQNALAELMDLMKLKFPDKHNMDYSEILESLKIPAALVGYDSDNDCFITPTDTNILLSKLNNM